MARTRTPATLKHVSVNKLGGGSRKIGPKRIRLPWRTKPKRHKLTYPERKALLEKRRKKKGDVNERLKEIREYVLNAAIKMKEDFGGHDHKYYYRLVMQQSELAFSDPQAISLWNAFVSAEYSEFNKGTFWPLHLT